MKEKVFVCRIEGMDCADCALEIERKVFSLKGVRKAYISFATGRLTVKYDGTISKNQIIEAVKKAGYKPTLKEERKIWWKNPKNVFLAISGTVLVFTLLLSRFDISERLKIFLYTIIIVVGGFYPVRRGLNAVKNLNFNLNFMLIVATIGAVALGLWEEGAILVVVYSLGEVLQDYASDRIRGSIKALMNLRPRKAIVRRNGEEKSVLVENLQVGEVVIVKPGEKIPVDGKVLKGSSSVDQSMITGESMPLFKKMGDEVYEGTINQRGSLEIEVTKLSKDTTLSKIIHLVEEAQARKLSYQVFSEKFGERYTPAMLVLAILTVAIPVVLFKKDFNVWFYRGLVVLVVSCSCALILSVPVSVVAAIGNAARNGVLVKGGLYLEAAEGLEVMVFDKTGTLTYGKPEVTDIFSFSNHNEREILSLAALIEKRSEHPLAEAILRRAEDDKIDFTEVDEFESITGMGAKARINKRYYYVGSPRLFEGKLKKEILKKVEELQDEAKTVVLVGTKEEILGVIAVADQIRKESKKTIKKLKQIGIRKIIMLTGDNELTAKAISEKAGVDEFYAELLPEDKIKVVKELQKKYGKVGMIGDGVNDAPALAQADVGIAMGAVGTDVALETADIALMADDLSKLPYSINLSKRSVSNIKENIAASLVIIGFLVPAALLGFIELVPGLLINEAGALIVILNALRLLR